MKKRSDDSYASIEQVEIALQGLATVDLLRLDELSRSFIAENSIISPEKLLKETLTSILEGKRRWPLDVNFLIFLRNALRSKANGYWEKQKKLFFKLQVESDNKEINDPEQVIIFSEHNDLVQKRYDEIWTLFDGHDVIEAILLGREEGLPPLEIQEQFGISKTDYASALRSMRRKLSKKFPKGWRTW